MMNSFAINTIEIIKLYMATKWCTHFGCFDRVRNTYNIFHHNIICDENEIIFSLLYEFQIVGSCAFMLICRLFVPSSSHRLNSLSYLNFAHIVWHKYMYIQLTANIWYCDFDCVVRIFPSLTHSKYILVLWWKFTWCSHLDYVTTG